MPEGPTTEGSIVAYLRLNDSDWNQKLDAAEARARELGRTDPTIRVAAETGDAIAKLEAVRAAEGRLGGGSTSVSSDKASSALATAQTRLAAAERAAANAASTQYLAELRLADVQDKRGRTEYQVAAAEEAVARATRNAEAAETRHLLATQALKDAEAASARAALENAAAQEIAAKAEDSGARAALANAEANDVQAKSTKNTAAATNLVVAAIAAAIPLAGSLTAATVAVGGGLAGMGAAGVLAIGGIKNEMKAGTEVGKDYTAGVADLKSVLTDLENTSAVQLLNDFDRAVELIDRSLPGMNSEISGFTSILGLSGLNVLRAAIDGFHIMNPLFVEGAQYAERLSEGILMWTENGGLQRFTNYARSELPIVEHAIGSVATTAVHTVEALSPFGTVALEAVTALSNVINAIPEPVLTDLIGLSGGVWAGFQTWRGIEPIVTRVAGALGVAADTAFGPWGLAITGALSALALVGGSFDARAADVDTLTSSLDRNTGAITSNTKADVVSALQKSGAFDAAKKLGIGLDTVTDAAMGNQEAVNKINQAMVDYANNPANSTAKVAAYRSNWNNLTNDIGANSKAVQDSIQKGIDTAKALGVVKQAQDNLDQSTQAATQAVKENGATFDLNTSKGEANKLALDKVIQSSQDLINAHVKEGDSQKAVNTVYDAQVKSLLGVAAQMGLTGAAADQYVKDHLGKIPTAVTTKIQANIDGAMGKIQEFTTALDRINGQTVTVYAQANIAAAQKALDTLHANSMIQANQYATGNAYATGHADGGIIAQYRAAGGSIDYLAGGGNPFQPRGTDTVPAMLTPGEFVVKQQSASYDRGFLSAYNAHPRAALDSVRGQGQTIVSLKGATFVMQVDGRQITAVIQDQIVAANRQQKAGLQGGMQDVAL